ncbi:MAG: hypothetical protein ACKVPX_15530 [Myxococcaceae bacterium]
MSLKMEFAENRPNPSSALHRLVVHGLVSGIADAIKMTYLLL